MLTLIAALVGLAAGIALASALLLLRSGSRVHVAEREADTIRREAQIEAREHAVRLRAEIEDEVQERRLSIAKIEERVVTNEHDVERLLTEVTRREQGLSDREAHVRELQEELKAGRQQIVKELERIAGLTVVDAKQHLLERSEDLIRH